jgi:hypothetical protein
MLCYLVISVSSESFESDFGRRIYQYPYFQAFLSVVSVSSVIVPGLVSTILIFKPCTPPFPGLWLFSCTLQDDTFQRASVEALILSCLTLWILLGLMGSATLIAAYGPVLEVFAILLNLRKLQSLSKWRKFVQPVKMSEFTIFKYKQLQLLVLMFNECYRWTFFVWVMSMVYVVIGINLYAFVKFYSKISSAESLFFCMLWIEGFIGSIVLNTISGNIYHISRNIPRTWLRIRPVYRN